MDILPQKQCKGPCGRTLPYTAEYFHVAKDRKSGLEAQCKECKSARQKAHFTKPSVRDHRKSYNSLPHVQESQKASREKRDSDPEARSQYLSYQKEYNKLPERQEKNLIYAQKPESRARNKAYLKAYNDLPEVIEHRRSPENRPQWCVNSHTRRARKKSVKGEHTVEQIQAQLKRQKYRCYYAPCGHAKFEKKNGKYIYNIEHTFPLSRVAGTDIPANSIDYLVLACPSCNSSKHDKFPWEWPEGGRLL